MISDTDMRSRLFHTFLYFFLKKIGCTSCSLADPKRGGGGGGWGCWPLSDTMCLMVRSTFAKKGGLSLNSLLLILSQRWHFKKYNPKFKKAFNNPYYTSLKLRGFHYLSFSFSFFFCLFLFYAMMALVICKQGPKIVYFWNNLKPR